jgi:hypothetical protein
MKLPPETSIDIFRSSSRWAPYAMVSILVAIGLVTVLGLPAAVIVIVARQQGGFAGGDVLGVAGLLVGSLTAFGLLVIGIIIYRQIETLLEKMTAIDQQTAILAEQSMVRTQAHTYAQSAAVNPAEIRALLEKIHEVLLLPEQERAARFRALMDKEFARRLATVDHLVSTSEFHQAREELGVLAERFGEDPRILEAANRLEKAAEAGRANDTARVIRFVKELVAQGRWDESERVMVELAKKYPNSAEPAGLLERLRQERKKFELQNRQRMHDEIQQFVNERRWQEALTATHKFVEAFPAGPDTDALKAQLPTLEANAEIQARQTLERYIKDYIEKQQYWDALALARRILTDYPLSPQANALRAQIPRLEELARKQAPAPKA